MTLCRRILSLSLLIVLSIVSTSAQSQYIKYFGKPGMDKGYALCPGIDGGYLVASISDSAGPGTEELALIKVSSTGQVSWSRTYGGNGYDHPLFAFKSPDSTYVVIGVSEIPMANREVYIMKLNAVGDIIWSKLYGGSYEELGISVRSHPDGGYLILSAGASFTGGSWDGWIMRLDNDGNVLWLHTYGGSGTESFTNSAPTSDGGFIITGHTFSYGAGQHDALLMKISKDGTYQWMKTYGTYADETGYFVRETPDKGFLVCATSAYGFIGGTDCLAIKTDSLGNLVSVNAYGTPNNDEMQRGYLLEPDRMMVGGFAGADAWSGMIGPDGIMHNSWRYEVDGVERIYGAYLEPSGARVLAGYTTAGSPVGENILLIRTDAEGKVAGGSVAGPMTPQTAPLSVSSPTVPNSTQILTAQAGPTAVDTAEFTSGFLVEVQKPLVYVMPSYGQASDSVTIPVKVTNPFGIAGGDISVAIDTSLLIPYGVRKGTLTQDFMLAFNISRPDSILVSFARVGGIGAVHDGSLFFVDCYVRADAGDSAVAAIGLPSVKLYDDQAQLLLSDVADGHFSTHLGLKGDVNQDMFVNAADAILCLRLTMLMGPIVEDPRAYWAADVDGNGVVTSLDAVNILRTSVQLPSIVEVGANSTVVTITIPRLSASLGAITDASIRVTGLPSLVSGSLELGFDPLSFQVESVEGRADFPGVVTHGVTESNDVRIGFASATAWQKADAVLADVHVKALRTVSSYLPSIRNVRMYDDSGLLITTFEFVTTGVEDDELRPLEFSLSANYPNPFNPTTEIRYHISEVSGQISEARHVRLTVHDILGREVATLVNGMMSAGSHRVTFDASDLPSGMYMYTLTSGSSIQRRRMLLVR